MAESKTVVVCDSTSYLPDELLRELDAHLISLYVSIDGDQRRELDIGDYTEFFERLKVSEDGASTSQPSIGDFLAVYEPLLEQGHEIVSVHLSASISGTWEGARQARQQLLSEGKGGERIHIYDSRSTAGGLGLMVITAARAAQAGVPAEQVIERCREAREHLGIWFAVDTLEFLRKGGRIGAAGAWVGSALQIKPILTLQEEVTPVERVRTRKRVFERMKEYARELRDEGCDGWVVQHIRDPENARRLVEEAREIIGTDPALVSEIGPVIGAHAGPGLIGIAGIPKRYLDGPEG